MGLITETVEVYYNNHYKYYESLGYKFEPCINKKGKLSRRKDIPITVKVCDLSSGSNVMILCTCDNCGAEKNMKYCKYVSESKMHDGKIYCHSCACKILNSKENCWNWNKDKTDEERYNDRNTFEYREFVNKVLARDNYICQCCGYTDDLKVHHLNGYNWYIEGRYDVNNGITLCGLCHNDFHTKYGHGDNTKEQYEEWVGHIVENKNYKDIEYKVAKDIINLDTGEINVASVFSKKYKTEDTLIYQCCNRKARSANNFHFLYYEDYISMTKKEIDEYLEWTKCNSSTKKIICITTGKIFYSLPEIEKEYPLCSKKAVWYCLNNNGTTSGKLEDGTPLQWMYYDDYLIKIENGEKISLRENSNYRKIICITTNEVFHTIQEGAKAYSIGASNIASACNGITTWSGKLSDGTKLRWMFYEKYLEMKENSKEIILSECKISKKKVVCITTGKIYESLTDAAKDCCLNSVSSITQACNGKIKTAGKLPDGTKLVWMFYDKYIEKVKNNEVISKGYIWNSQKKVICLSSGEIFESLKQASDKYGLKNSVSISNACMGKCKSAGKSLDGMPLFWMYYDEYIKKIENNEKIELFETSHYKKVICTTTGVVFNSIREGANKYELKYSSSISNVCKNERKSYGKLPNGKNLRWMYYEDFLKLPQEEQQEILSRNQ